MKMGKKIPVQFGAWSWGWGDFLWLQPSNVSLEPEMYVLMRFGQARPI